MERQPRRYPTIASRKRAGLDPIFRNNDGSNCKGADLSTLAARQSAFSLLLNKGLIRSEMQVPAGAEFEIVDVDDPYGCGAPYNTLSMYRRPLPTTNLAFLSTVMWDGRETVKGQAIRSDLVTQASNATTGHAEGAGAGHGAAAGDRRLRALAVNRPGAGSRCREPVEQRRTRWAGDGCTPAVLYWRQRSVEYPSGDAGRVRDPSGGLDPDVFSLFGAWEDAGSPHRQAIARGEKLFNTRTFVIDNVGGLNGRAGGSRDRPDPVRDVHDVPRHAERRQPLDLDAAQSRPHGRSTADTGPAALHDRKQSDARANQDD